MSRAQISLQFEDKNLYEKFVKPYKEQHILNGLIIKLISSYFYNEDVRNLVEGTSLDDIEENKEVQNLQAICNDIRTTVLMQDYLSSELQNTINVGSDDINDIMNQTNRMATETGTVHETKNDFGSTVFKLDTPLIEMTKNNQSQSANTQDADIKTLFGVLVGAVVKLAESSGNSEVSNMLTASLGGNFKLTGVAEQKTLSQSNDAQVLSDETSGDSKIIATDNKNDESLNNVEVTEHSDSQESEIEVIEDASDSMDDLLASLGI